jgi:hypothetical protein
MPETSIARLRFLIVIFTHKIVEAYTQAREFSQQLQLGLIDWIDFV